MLEMWRGLLVGLGGMVGSVARYWLAGVVQALADTDFPLGTLTVNFAGSFLLGLIVTLSIDRGAVGPDARLFLAVGMCGGFTTMSTFSYETLALLERGLYLLALWNIATTLGICLVAVWLGVTAGRLM